MTDPTTVAQPARATRARTPRPASVLELEVPPSAGPAELVISAVVPVKPGAGPTVPAFLVEGIQADVLPHARDAQGRPTSVLVSAPVNLTGKAPGSFARLRLEATGEPYQPSEVRDVGPMDLEFVLQTPDGVFRAKPFVDASKGEKVLGRHRSTWRSSATLEGPNGTTRGLVIACVELRVDGLAVLEFFAVNGLQPYSESAGMGGDFCYQELELHTSSAIVIPLPRKGERVLRDGRNFVARLVDDGLVHLWPRMQGALRRFVLAPPDASQALVARATDVGRFYGTAFAVEGPNSWIDCPSHGPELALLAPWTDSLDVWGPKGQAGARKLLDDSIGGLWGYRTGGGIGGAFLEKRMALFHPLGQYQEGEPGGWKIRPTGSFALDRRLVLQRWLELEHTLDRTRAFHYEPRSGKPTSSSGWASSHGGRVPFAWKNHGDGRFPWMSLPRNPNDGSIVRTSNVTQGRMIAHVDDALLRYDEHDDQHGVREDEPVETVVRFTGSSLALSILESFAANGELARHEFQSPNGDVTLVKLLSETGKKPNSGATNAGRGLAWDLASIANFWEYAPDGWRLARAHWVRLFTNWILTSRGPAGLICNDPDTGHVTEVAIHDHGCPEGYRYVQTFEEAYMSFSIEKLATLALPGIASDRERRSVYQGLVDAFRSLWSVRLASNSLVPLFVAVGHKSGAELPALSAQTSSHDAEGTWIWGMIACAARSAVGMGDAALYDSLMSGPLLHAGRAPESPSPNLEAYVRSAQALEREPWHGSADYSALAWGEAWKGAHGGGTSPSSSRGIVGGVA